MLLSGCGIPREGEKGPASPFLCPPVSPVTPSGQTLGDTRVPGKQKRARIWSELQQSSQVANRAEKERQLRGGSGEAPVSGRVW